MAEVVPINGFEVPAGREEALPELWSPVDALYSVARDARR